MDDVTSKSRAAGTTDIPGPAAELGARTRRGHLKIGFLCIIKPYELFLKDDNLSGNHAQEVPMPSARDELDNEPQAKEKDKNKDAVIQEYDVYLTPELQQQLYLLQYPNRARDHTFVRYAYPENMRIKPESGFLELDLPVHFTNFDKARGVEWGEALHRVKEEGGGGLGIAGGFGGNSGRAGGLRTRKAKVETAGAGAGGFVNGDAAADVGAEDEEVAKLVDNFEDSVERGRVLNKQTLGGQILKHQEGQPVYMLGAFRGRKLSIGLRAAFRGADRIQRSFISRGSAGSFRCGHSSTTSTRPTASPPPLDVAQTRLSRLPLLRHELFSTR